jgi:hypothetical protein
MPTLFWRDPPVASGAKFNDLTASWIEVVAGLKAKVFDNVFIGFSLVSKKAFDNPIPGFNRTYDGDFGVGLNYTVSYFIPIFKKKKYRKSNKNGQKL